MIPPEYTERLKKLTRYDFKVSKGLDGIKLMKFPMIRGEYIEYSKVLEFIKIAEKERLEINRKYWELSGEYKNTIKKQTSKQFEWSRHIKELKVLTNKLSKIKEIK